MMTLLDMPDDEPVDYNSLASLYREEHTKLIHEVHSVLSKSIRLGGRNE